MVDSALKGVRTSVFRPKAVFFESIAGIEMHRPTRLLVKSDGSMTLAFLWYSRLDHTKEI